MVAFLAGDVSRRRTAGSVAAAVLAAGSIANLAAVALRWVAAGRPPLSNMHECLVFVAFPVAVTAAVVHFRYRLPFVGAISSLAAALAIGYASLLDSSITPVMPALKSNWLVIHVTSYFVGYGALIVATAAAAAVILTSFGRHVDQSRQQRMDSLSFRLILFAFPFMTVGLTTGAVWANVAWGRYWGWDPKETWSLVTWLVYALYLHLRTMRGWRGRRTAVIALCGFVFVIFTFFGVNFLIGGLHSYM